MAGASSDTSSLRVFMAAALAVQPVYGLLWSIQGPFVRLHGYSGFLYGVLGSAMVFSSIAGSLLAGFASDRYGAKAVVVVGVFLSSLGMLLFSIGGFWFLLAASIVIGASTSSVYVAFTALLSRSFPDNVMDRAFSFVSAASTIGVGLGSFLGWIPVFLAGSGLGFYRAYQVVLAGSGIVLPILSLPFLFKIREGGVKRAEPSGSSGLFGLAGLFARLVLIEALFGLGSALSIQNIDYYFVLKYGVESGELGTVFGLEQFIMGGLMLFMPKASRLAGSPLRAFIAITSPSVPLLLAMTVVDNYAAASAIFIARSVLMNVASPLYQAFQLTLLPRGYRGRGAALLGLAWQVPSGVGRSIGGYLLDVDVELPLRVTAGLYAAALGMLLVFFSNKRDQRAEA